MKDCEILSPLRAKYQLHRLLCEGLNDLYVTKNTDYDDSFGKSIQEDGYLAAVVRLGDKLNRIKKLISNPNTAPIVSGESVGDTLRDMANYSLMLLVEYMIHENVALPIAWLSLAEQAKLKESDSWKSEYTHLWNHKEATISDFALDESGNLHRKDD